ncbi:MAG: immunity 22 family protein [Candidatus Saccharibacteria bacterium]|nr:immunity 22 family protein [Moraxellaceae bacterium]
MPERDYSEDENYYSQGFERDGVVSIWLELAKHQEESEDDALQDCCGVGYYNLDHQETNYLDEVAHLDQLFADISYSDSFSKPPISKAKSMGIESAYWVLAQFNFAYDPSRVKREPTNELVFIGFFSYSTTQSNFGLNKSNNSLD